MSQVTERVKNLAKHPIKFGSALSLLPSGIALLSAFAFMKAVCASHAIIDDGEEPFFTRATRERFPTSLMVPSDVRIWIAAFQGQWKYSGRFVPGILSCKDNPQFRGIEWFAFSYVIGHLVLQVHAARWQDVRRRGGRAAPLLNPDPYWDPAVLRLWPSEGCALTWPPMQYLDDDSLKEFMNRLAVPVAISQNPSRL